MRKFRLDVFFSTVDMDVEKSLSGLFACLDPCKGIQDSLGRGIPDTGYQILCQWNLDSGF